MASRIKSARHGSSAPHHRVLTGLMWATAAVVGFAAVYAGTNLYLLQSSLTTRDISALIQSDNDSQVALASDGTPLDGSAGNDVNVLLMGSDIRDGENGEIGGVVEGMRSDTTIIMHISEDRSRVEFISIPRDSRVAISDCTLFDGSTVRGWTTKFNTAFSNGGSQGDAAEAAACTIKTVQDLTGISIDNYAVVDFSGFESMIDALGGVPMCISNDISSKKANLYLDEGAQVLDGETALAYARARTGTGLPEGTDLRRIDRQQELLMNILRKALGQDVLTDVPTLTKFARAGAESLTMDPVLGNLSYLAGLGYSLRNLDTDNIAFITVPWEYPSDRNGDVVWSAEADDLFAKIIADQPAADPEIDASPSASPSADGTIAVSDSDAIGGATSSEAPSAIVTPSSEPSTSATPLRETESDILASCN